MCTIHGPDLRRGVTNGHNKQVWPPRIPLFAHRGGGSLGTCSLISSLAACDASMLLAPPSPHQPRSVTFATVTSSFLVGSLSSFGNGAFILHGEVYGLISAFLLSAFLTSPVSVYSDHLSSVRNMTSVISRTPSSLRPSFASFPSCSLYHCLRDLVVTHPLLSLHHVWAHTSSTLASATNRLVDFYATSAQQCFFPPPPTPVPTFMMDHFTPFHTSLWVISKPTCPVWFLVY